MKAVIRKVHQTSDLPIRLHLKTAIHKMINQTSHLPSLQHLEVAHTKMVHQTMHLSNNQHLKSVLHKTSHLTGSLCLKIVLHKVVSPAFHIRDVFFTAKCVCGAMLHGSYRCCQNTTRKARDTSAFSRRGAGGGGGELPGELQIKAAADAVGGQSQVVNKNRKRIAAHDENPPDCLNLSSNTVVLELTSGIMTVFSDCNDRDFRAADQANQRCCFSKASTCRTETKKTETRATVITSSRFKDTLLKKKGADSVRQTGKGKASKPQLCKSKNHKKPLEDQVTTCP